jgi:hypothetical protein
MRQVVRQVQEVYLDYFPHNPELFTLDVASCMSLEPPHSDHAVLHRIASGITALLLALKVSPAASAPCHLATPLSSCGYASKHACSLSFLHLHLQQ